MLDQSRLLTDSTKAVKRSKAIVRVTRHEIEFINVVVVKSQHAIAATRRRLASDVIVRSRTAWPKSQSM